MKKEDKTREQIKVVCQIEKIFSESDKTYGYRAIQAELKKQGTEKSGMGWRYYIYKNKNRLGISGRSNRLV